ncbi:hypothetical protein ES703_86891 [subsurface metagenome]
MTELMTVEEVADYLRVTRKTIYRLLKQGSIPAAKVGHQWRFDKPLIDKWLQPDSVTAKATILVTDAIVYFFFIISEFFPVFTF